MTGSVRFVIVDPDGWVVSEGQTSPATFEAMGEAVGSVHAVPEGSSIGAPHWRLVDGQFVALRRPVPLEIARERALARIDREAEEARLRFMTPGAGQAMEYEATEAEARRFLAVEQPFEPASFPVLAAELAALVTVGDPSAQDPRAVATGIVTAADRTRAALAAIKRVRRAAKLAVGMAKVEADVEAAAKVIWPAAG